LPDLYLMLPGWHTGGPCVHRDQQQSASILAARLLLLLFCFSASTMHIRTDKPCCHVACSFGGGSLEHLWSLLLPLLLPQEQRRCWRCA
jgi:hypothetical protein